MIIQFKTKLSFGIFKTIFSIVLFALLSLIVTPVFACVTPPSEKFCVDYYKNINLDGKPTVSRKAPKIKYSWVHHRPAKKIPKDNFSARWRGRFKFLEGQYNFRVLADEGVRLLVDGKAIIDHWQYGEEKEHQVKFNLGAGKHLVEVEYFNSTGEAYLNVEWNPVSLDVKTSTVNNPVQDITPLTSTVNNRDKRAYRKKILVRNNNKTNAALLRESQKKGVVTDLNQAPIGVNLSSFSYWSSSVPFKDLLIQSGSIQILKNGSNKKCSKQPAKDQDGFPKYLPRDCVIRIWSVFHIPHDDFWPADTPPYQPGRYVLLHQGKGKIKLGWDAINSVVKGEGRIEFDVLRPKNGIQIEIMSMDSNDAIRDMHIVHIDDELTFNEQPFNETWLELLKPFEVLRFMDWGRVSQKNSVYYGKAESHSSLSITLPDTAPSNNGVFDGMVVMVNVDNKWPRVFVDSYDGGTRTLHLKTPIEISKSGKPVTVNIFDFVNRVWDSRASATTFEQGSIKGVAFELMIKLANTLNVDPWINIPTAADDNFVEKLAEMVKNQLNPNLKCYIEYSNETWNYSYPGYHYSEAMMRELNLKGTIVQADAWHAYRAIEMFKIFNRVFGESDLHKVRQKSRLVRVLASQTAWYDRAESVMDWKMPDNEWPTQGKPAFEYADAWAVTAYFSIKDSNKILNKLSMAEVFDKQIKHISDSFGTPKKPGVLRKLLTRASKRNLQLVGYEGGTHLLAPVNKPEMLAKVAKINKDQRMKSVYQYLFDQWDSLYQEFGPEKVGVLNQFNDISRYSKHGYWGVLQSTYQNPETAPKYQAIRDWKIK